MSKLLRAFRSSLEADPGPWLLAASAILAVALWNLPIPAFLFAQEGSGSAGPCDCRVKDPCVDWSVRDDERECRKFEPPWEKCNDNAGNPDGPCGAGKKHKVPLSEYVYERGTPENQATRCQNTRSHADSGEQYEHDVTWRRTVQMEVTQAGAGKDVEFNPTLAANLPGFEDENVCKTEDYDAAIRIRVGLYAKLKIGSAEDIDERKGEGATLGWDFQEFNFAYDSSTKRWEFSSAAPIPYVSQFQTKIENRPCSTENAEEIIQFKCRIVQEGKNENKYVRFGKRAMPAAVWLSASSDETTCQGF